MLVLKLCQTLRNDAVRFLLSWRFNESGKRQKAFCACFLCIVSFESSTFRKWTLSWWFFKCKMPNEDSLCHVSTHDVFPTHHWVSYTFTFRLDNVTQCYSKNRDSLKLIIVITMFALFCPHCVNSGSAVLFSLQHINEI